MTNGVSLIGSSTTNFSNPPLNQILNQLASVKLDRGNYLLWQTLALPILKSYKLQGHLTEENQCPPKFIINPTCGASSRSTTTKTVNPKFDQWVTFDLLLLGWMYNSMTPEVALQLMGFNTAKDLWEAIQDLFGVQLRAEEDFLRHTFQTTQKGHIGVR
ncbi:uncharacterized protein LOC116405217 [Cucumis sativus]|uniref:uncharacterized protein LOC116405217 n=1 Tax=Cucumis sativus TaxID=3659 RepID=UPI0012F5167F|nr:uncharacterized protein LOC116405217 [Cucumis sativus]